VINLTSRPCLSASLSPQRFRIENESPHHNSWPLSFWWQASIKKPPRVCHSSVIIIQNTHHCEDFKDLGVVSQISISQYHNHSPNNLKNVIWSRKKVNHSAYRISNHHVVRSSGSQGWMGFCLGTQNESYHSLSWGCYCHIMLLRTRDLQTRSQHIDDDDWFWSPES
jgi:hypothetical protein